LVLGDGFAIGAIDPKLGFEDAKIAGKRGLKRPQGMSLTETWSALWARE
jgi:hypothetical protein